MLRIARMAAAATRRSQRAHHMTSGINARCATWHQRNNVWRAYQQANNRPSRDMVTSPSSARRARQRSPYICVREKWRRWRAVT